MLYKEKPSSTEYDAKAKLVNERFHQFGGLPRYLLNDSKTEDRKQYMTPLHAKKDADLLLSALISGRLDDHKKLLTIFLTMYPGVDETGKYNPSVKYSTVEFVSHGALRAAGPTVFGKIHSDVVWRNSTGASSLWDSLSRQLNGCSCIWGPKA